MLWDSKTNTIHRRFGSDSEAKPFKEGDLLGKMWGQARKLKRATKTCHWVPIANFGFLASLGSYS